MRRTLSSRMTYWWKFVVPLLIIATVFFLIVLGVRGYVKRGVGWEWVFHICLYAVAVWTAVSLRSLKWVEADEQFLYVSDFQEEISIPLTEIHDVCDTSRGFTGRARITLRPESTFGDVIRFIPRFHCFYLCDPHPVVRELLALMEKAKQTEPVA